MVVRLLEFAAGNNLPSGVSKGSDKSRDGKSSPFIAFLVGLQKAIPEGYRRHLTSPAALARAVWVASRGRRSRQNTER